MWSPNSSRIEQVVETIHRVREQAPDLQIEVVVRDPRRTDGVCSKLTIEGDKVFEETYLLDGRSTKDVIGKCEVGPCEDPLLIAGSMIDDARNGGKSSIPVPPHLTLEEREQARQVLAEAEHQQREQGTELLYTVDVARDKHGNLIRCRYCSAHGSAQHDEGCYGKHLEWSTPSRPIHNGGQSWKEN